MKKAIRYILLSITSILLISTIGYSAFLINQIKDDSSKVIDNTYKVVLHYRDQNNVNLEVSTSIEGLEEDSYFDLPVLNYETLVFSGWSLYESRSSSIDLKSINIKYVKENYNDVSINDKTLNLYSIINNIDENHVLLKINDNTSTPLTYYMKTEAKLFNLFNIRYVYPSTFVNITINEVNYNINDMFDLTSYGGKTLEVFVTTI